MKGPVFGHGDTEEELLAHDICRCLEKILYLQERKYDRKDPEYRRALKKAMRIAKREGFSPHQLKGLHELHVATGGITSGKVQDDELWRRLAPPALLVREVMES